MNTTNQGTPKGIMTIFSTRQTRAYSLLFFLVIMWGLWLPANPPQALAQTPTTQNGLFGEYFESPDLTNFSRGRIDPLIDMPNTILVYKTGWSARWLGYIVPDHTEDYSFCLDVQDGARLYIDETLIIDEWLYPDITEYGLRTVCSDPINLIAGNGHNIRLEYYELQNDEELRLYWQSASTPYSLVPTTALFIPEVNYNPTDVASFQYALRMANRENCPATATTITLPANSEYIGQGITINCSVIIEGNNSTFIRSRFYTGISSAFLTLRDLTITGSSARVGGAMSLNRGQAVIENVQFIGNTAYGYYNVTTYGGAIFVDTYATLTVRNSLFAYNSSLRYYSGRSAYGGAIGGRGTIIIEDTNFYGNYAESSGGAIYIVGSVSSPNVTELHRVNIQNNTAENSGGAIVTQNLYADNSCFINNADSADENLNIYNATSSATNSYWGSSDGPSGAYTGSGDSVKSLQTDVTGILASAPSYCDDPVTSINVPDGAHQFLRNIARYTEETSVCSPSPLTINLANNGTYNFNYELPFHSRDRVFPVYCPVIINGNNSTFEMNDDRWSPRLFEVEGRQGLGEGSLHLYDLNVINTSPYVYSNFTPYTASVINSFEGDVWIEDSSFSPAPVGQDGAYGGAIQVTQANFDFINSEIRNSQLSGVGTHGSAIALLDASARITGSTITTNISDEAEAIYTNSSLTITDTDINFNASNGVSDALLVELTDVADIVSIRNSCISGQPNIAINSIGLGTVDASYNWWGASDGPSNAGGSGDSISGTVAYSNHLLAKPLFCSDTTVVSPPPITIANGDTSALITAIETLNSSTCGLEAQVINLHPDGYYEFDSVMGNDYYTDSALVVTCPLTINGNGATLAPSSTVPRMRWMSATAPMSGYQAFGYNFLALNDIILENWGYDEDNVNLDYIDGDGYGSGVYLRGGNVVINNSIMRNNIGYQGGVFYIEGASIEINDSLFDGNFADYQGGAIYLYNLSSLVINNSDFNNHETYDDGGVITSEVDYNLATFNEITIDSSRFDANHSYSDGGVIYVENTNVTITGVNSPTIFTNNHSYYGGAIYVYGNLSASDTIFDGNNSGGDGGAIVVDGGFILSNVEARNNSADGIGGFAYPDGGWEFDHVFLIEDSLIENNSSTDEGGAIYAGWDDYTLEPVASIINTEFLNNTSADDGGGLYFYQGVFAIEDSTIDGNTSQTSGGAIYSERARFDIQNTNIRYNSAEINGGAIYVIGDNDDATSNIISDNTVIIGNRAGDSGGAVYSSIWYPTSSNTDAPIDITNTIIINNFALNEGDALYIESSDDASSIHNSCIVSNGATSVYTTGILAVDAIDNWWGDASGPIGTSIIGTDNVSTDVNYTPFLTVANLGCDTFLDTDGDLLIDDYEIILGTDPNQADTDNDGDTDGIEVLAFGTNPLLGVDTDGDGLNDDAEITGRLNINYGNAPTLADDADTDDDDLDDGAEIALGTNPNDDDTDDDTLIDGDEVSGILNINYNNEATSPILSDTDGDGLDDDEEIALGTNPNEVDTDGDGLDDPDEISGILNIDYNNEATSPILSDTDGDGLDDDEEIALGTNPNEVDTDEDTLIDGDEVNTYFTSPTETDSDDDTLSDPDEISGILNTGYNNEATSPILSDTDADGWSDSDEINTYGTDPNDDDTDDDTILDNIDNCALVANVDQADHDNDGEGDSCEAGPVDRFNTSVSVDDYSVNADGIDTTTMTITVRDANDRVMNNVPVSITVNRLDGTDPTSLVVLSNVDGISDTNGEFQTTISNTRAELVEFEIQIGADYDLIYGYEEFVTQPLEFVGPDMSVSVTALSQITAGQTLIYAIDVENLGGITATDINLFAGVTLGAGMIESITTPAGIQLDQQGPNSVSWLIPSAPAGSSYQILLYVRSAANLQLYDRVAFETVIEASSDSDSTNNRATANTNIGLAVAPQAQVQSDKLDVQYYADTTTGVIGETVTLTIEVTNNTVDETLYNLEGFAALKDTFASAFEFASIVQFDWLDLQTSGTLLPGQTATATFDYLITDGFMNISESIRTVRISADDANPTDGGDNVATYDVLDSNELDFFGPGPQSQLLADKTNGCTRRDGKLYRSYSESWGF